MVKCKSWQVFKSQENLETTTWTSGSFWDSSTEGLLYLNPLKHQQKQVDYRKNPSFQALGGDLKISRWNFQSRLGTPENVPRRSSAKLIKRWAEPENLGKWSGDSSYIQGLSWLTHVKTS